MAGITNVVGLPEIVKIGGAVEERYAYTADASEAVGAGDLIRISTSGSVKLAEDNADATGAIAGIALEATTAGSGLSAPVILFANDTVISMPIADDTNWTDDYSAGVAYELDPASVTGTWAISTDATAGIFKTVEPNTVGAPWSDPYGSFSQADDEDNVGGRVLCTVPQSVLDGINVA